MKLVSFTSFKGGAGKTTSLMAALPGLLASGRRVALFEGDANDSLKLWRRNAREIGTWDEDCAIYEATDLKVFEKSFEAAQAAGYDVALLDEHGGHSELNTTVFLSSDLVIIPTSLTPIDIEIAISTFQFVVEIMKEHEASIPTAFLLTSVPTTAARQSKSDAESLELLERVPQLTARLPLRTAFSDLHITGMLHIYHKKLLTDPGKRIQRRHVEVAMREAAVLSKDILDEIDG